MTHDDVEDRPEALEKACQNDQACSVPGKRPMTAAERMREEQIRASIGRRGFFKLLGLGTLGLGFGVSIFDRIFTVSEVSGATEEPVEETKHRLIMIGTVDFMGFRAKEITPNQEFYITTYSTEVPEIDPDKHRLRVEGLVNKPSIFTVKDLEAIKDKKEFVTLQCIGNPVGGDSIGNALWEGVTLKKILDLARPGSGIVKAALFGEDGYSDSIPYDLARSDDVFLAWSMNGEPLPKEHGHPLRLIVPGIYGMKNVKWISKVELVNYNFKGYWEKKGWSDEAIMPVKSQILMPMSGKSVPLGKYMVGGVAFGGRYGISKVQVSVDDGKNWSDAQMKPPLSKWAWSLWEYDWTPQRKGDYRIAVRGFDRSGKVQESTSLFGRVAGSFPSGAKGIHHVDVTAM
jgi:DMSO/TMAO reductase YedYZ molybdopterin-dependent catalytic subunit